MLQENKPSLFIGFCHRIQNVKIMADCSNCYCTDTPGSCLLQLSHVAVIGAADTLVRLWSCKGAARVTKTSRTEQLILRLACVIVTSSERTLPGFALREVCM